MDISPGDQRESAGHRAHDKYYGDSVFLPREQRGPADETYQNGECCLFMSKCLVYEESEDKFFYSTYIIHQNSIS